MEDIAILLDVGLEVNNLLISCSDLTIEFTYIRIKSHHIILKCLDVLLHLCIATYQLSIFVGELVVGYLQGFTLRVDHMPNDEVQGEA